MHSILGPVKSRLSRFTRLSNLKLSGKTYSGGVFVCCQGTMVMALESSWFGLSSLKPISWNILQGEGADVVCPFMMLYNRQYLKEVSVQYWKWSFPVVFTWPCLTFLIRYFKITGKYWIITTFYWFYTCCSKFGLVTRWFRCRKALMLPLEICSVVINQSTESISLISHTCKYIVMEYFWVLYTTK